MHKKYAKILFYKKSGKFYFMKKTIDELEENLMQQKTSSWKTDVDKLIEQYLNSDPDTLADIVLQMDRYADDERRRYFTLRAEECILLRRPEKAAVGTGVSRYCRDCIDFCDRYGSEEADLEQQYNFAKSFLDAMDSYSEKNTVEFSENLIACKEIYKPFDPIMDEMININRGL